MKYRPLTLKERYTIATMKQAGHAHREIARVVGRPPSTIGREVRRNRSSKGYYHRSAHALARSRRRGKATITFDAAMRAQAEAKLQAGWSPEPRPASSWVSAQIPRLRVAPAPEDG